MKLSTSPDRGSFNREIIEKQFQKGQISQETYENWQSLMKRYEEERENLEKNLEFDLRTCDWIVDKCKKSTEYSKNLYSALCNNIFENNKNEEFSCSWRHAGGIVADLNEEGDYIDWYCSGKEGIINEEISSDLEKIGWKLKKHLGTMED